MPFFIGFDASKVQKQFTKLPKNIQARVYALFTELEAIGPELPGWRNFGKLKKKKSGRMVFHAHLNSGKPRYVAIWELIGESKIEILYLGTHENANYTRI